MQRGKRKETVSILLCSNSVKNFATSPFYFLNFHILLHPNIFYKKICFYISITHFKILCIFSYYIPPDLLVYYLLFDH